MSIQFRRFVLPKNLFVNVSMYFNQISQELRGPVKRM